MRLDTEKASDELCAVMVASPFPPTSPPPRTLLCAKEETEKLLGVTGEWAGAVVAAALCP